MADVPRCSRGELGRAAKFFSTLAPVQELGSTLRVRISVYVRVSVQVRVRIRGLGFGSGTSVDEYLEREQAWKIISRPGDRLRRSI